MREKLHNAIHFFLATRKDCPLAIPDFCAHNMGVTGKSFIPGHNVGLRKKEFVKPSAQQNGSLELVRGSIKSFKDFVEGVLVP